MNREILFRGKTEAGKWIYGFLFRSWEKAYILWGMENGKPRVTEVIPSTVGQYVNKTDTEGKKIFEGDYLGDWCFDDNDKEIFGHYGVVTYWEDECRWILADENGKWNDWTDEDEARPENWGNLYRMGNIHDLEVEK